MPNIEFVIPTYDRTDHLMCVISSIKAQTNPNWKIHVVADCPPSRIELSKVVDYFKEDKRIRFTVLSTRSNDWGHTPRNFGLKNCKEDWVVMTGEDNYYAPIFVEEFLKEQDKETNFVFCNMVTNFTNNQYIPMQCKIELGFIDIGCFMVRPELAKQIGIETKYKEVADGVLADKYIKRFGGKVKQILKVLYVHN
jgi:glycosyltransferase involved in cell wall biosynthesis